MSVTCECGEQVRDGQTFCRQCGKRAGGPRKSQDHTRELTRVRSAPPPQPHHPPPPPSGRGGPDPKVIFAGAFAVLALAGGAYAFANLGSDGGSGGEEGSREKVERSDESNPNDGIDAQVTAQADTAVESPDQSEATASDSQSSQAESYSGASASGGFSSGYIAQLGSYSNRAGAESDLVRLGAQGAANGILWSSDYSQMVPGYWVLYAGPFDSKGLADQAASASGVSDAFARWISTD